MDLMTDPKRTERRAAIGFWVLAGVLFTLMAAASAPSPLYIVYQHRWHFSATVLTTVFAVYALALLVTLLSAGGLSDYLGRRPVLVAGLLLESVSMATFLAAHGVEQLLIARVLQGIATGLATGAISAGLVDLQPSRPRLGALVNGVAPAAGLAAGALLAGLLVQYSPSATTVVFASLVAASLVLTVALIVVPETVTRRTGVLASLRPRAAVPPQARRQFLVVVPALVAAWAVGGLYLSLGPSLAAGVLGVSSHLVGALVVSTLFGVAAIAAVIVYDRPPRRVMTGGAVVLVAGAGVTLLALALTSTPAFFAGTAVAGAGFGSTFLGAFRSLAAIAAPQQRAEIFASMYVVSYLAFSVPAVLAGVAVGSFGLQRTSTVYGAAVILAALTVVLTRHPRGRHTGAADRAGHPAHAYPAVRSDLGN
jgi:predicted MFS family arabinose efflux permease